MKKEFYDITFRKKIYHSLDELETDPDEWLRKYHAFKPRSYIPSVFKELAL